MSPILVPRSTWHPGAPVSNDGTTPRRHIGHFPKGVAIHYTGGPKRARNYTADPVELMRSEQEWARSAGKSFEYNDKVLPRWDGSAVVCEYAGDYMGAHAGEGGKYEGNNSTRYAIQVAIGVDNHPSYASHDKTRPVVWEPFTDALLAAVRWRIFDLRSRGVVAWDCPILPDRELPGRATACPGEAVLGRWAELVTPWDPGWTDPPRPPTRPEAMPMFPMLFRLAGFADLVLIDGGQVMPVSGDLLTALRAQPEQTRPYERGGDAIANPWPDHPQTRAWLEHRLGYNLTATKDGK